MAEAFRFYRDELKLQVHPVYGPWYKRNLKAAGKAPIIEDWWTVSPQTWDLDHYFGGNGKCYNIGCAANAPKDDLIFVDLDSKVDKGETVRRFLAEHPECTKGPWHETTNGVHLVFLCRDLPRFRQENGDIIYAPVSSNVLENMTAELFHSLHSNIVLPPSVHFEGLAYRWAAFGEVPEVLWKWLQDVFKFEHPAKRAERMAKELLWFLRFKGDLKSLDIVAMLEHLGHPAELIDADDGKHSILCPWHEEHSEKGIAGSSTVVWQNVEAWPGFKCLHAHCSERDLQALLEWAEDKEPGIVDRFCKTPRTFKAGWRDEQQRPQILHPNNELHSDVYAKLGGIIGPKREWFKRGDSLVTINEVPSGFVYSSNPETAYTVEAHTTGFREITSQGARSMLENYVIPGYIGWEGTFIRKSFSVDFCSGMISADHLRGKLPHIVRVLTVPIPIRVGDKLVFPRSGYDEQFGTFLVPGAPQIKEMPLKRALKILEEIHADFPFTTPQSKTHAIARLITPFAHGLIGWTTRVPLWFYIANRPRAGKDYLAIIPLLVYEGYGFEDLPIDKESEETRKRIMAGARSGRHFMHFSNCQGYLQDPYFCQVITATVIAGRALGANDGASDLQLPNEMEFSLSANVGLTYREDFEGRMRKIELAYYQENANARAFRDPFLHETIKERRSEILSAIAALYRHWAGLGFPVGPTVFTSFPRWAQVVGGVMVAAELGDPCEPFEGKFDDVGGDRQTEAMRVLFKVCRTKFGDAWTVKKEIYKCVHEAAKEGNDALGYFGELADSEHARSNQTKLGMTLSRFKDRELGGIVLLILEKKDASANKYRFIKSEPLNLSEPSADRQENGPPPDNIKKGNNKRKDKDRVMSSDRLDVQKRSEVQIFDDPPANLSSASLAVDIETYSEPKLNKKGKILVLKDPLNPRKGEIRLLSICDPEGGLLLLDSKNSPFSGEVLEAIENRELIIHNADFEMRFFQAKFGFIPQKVFCTMTATKLLEPSKSVSHKLKDVLKRYLAVDLPKDLGGSDWGAMILTPEQLEYAKNDVWRLHALRDKLASELEKADLTKVFEMEMELLPIIVKMECHGFPIDIERMKGLKEDADCKLISLTAQLLREFGDPGLNLSSPAQLVAAFKRSGVEVPDTDIETLSRLDDPRARALINWRGADKLSTNIETLLKAAHGGRIYSCFNPFGTVTGRFSSNSPNLQNVPKGAVRSCFVPSVPDRRLIVVDYSQIELRVGALIANEEVMIKALRDGKDLHRKAAASALGKLESEVTKEQRNKVGKSVNFGFLYGQKPPGFVEYARTTYDLVVTLEEAERFRSNHFALNSGLARWHEECKAKAQDPANNSARTRFGRLLLAQNDNWWGRFVMLTNYVVQGSAADLLKVALIKADAVLPPSVNLISVVHDEVIYDAPANMAEQCKQVICQATIEAFVEMFGDTVPVEVEAKVCASWGEK
jgi:DNA polymerase-1